MNKFKLILLSSLLQSSSALIFQNKAASPKPTELLSELENLISTSNPSDENVQSEIKELMVSISESRQGDQRENLPGKWELIFTTEKEVNFFKQSWPFATVSEITQDFDLFDSEILNNSINFETGGCFAVKGKPKAVDGDSEYDRVAFEFKSATIRAFGLTFQVPPIGAGWFDTMYCDETYRLSRDVRGDWSVFRRLQ